MIPAKFDKNVIRERLLETETKRLKENHSSEAFYKTGVSGTRIACVTISPLLNGKNKPEALAVIEKLFVETSIATGVSENELILNASSSYAGMSFKVLETDEEFELRIKQMINREIEIARKRDADEEREKQKRQKRISELEAELVKLKNI